MSARKSYFQRSKSFFPFSKGWKQEDPDVLCEWPLRYVLNECPYTEFTCACTLSNRLATGSCNAVCIQWHLIMFSHGPDNSYLIWWGGEKSLLIKHQSYSFHWWDHMILWLLASTEIDTTQSGQNAGLSGHEEKGQKRRKKKMEFQGEENFKCRLI